VRRARRSSTENARSRAAQAMRRGAKAARRLPTRSDNDAIGAPCKLAMSWRKIPSARTAYRL
jgi:hypothetical protein